MLFTCSESVAQQQSTDQPCVLACVNFDPNPFFPRGDKSNSLCTIGRHTTDVRLNVPSAMSRKIERESWIVAWLKPLFETLVARTYFNLLWLFTVIVSATLAGLATDGSLVGPVLLTVEIYRKTCDFLGVPCDIFFQILFSKNRKIATFFWPLI